MTVWFDPSMISGGKPPGQRGRRRRYSDVAIQAHLMLKFFWSGPKTGQRFC
ncbi:transposase [Gluconobacter cerinus]|nr:transposase [Gluconobacter cerinus]